MTAVGVTTGAVWAATSGTLSGVVYKDAGATSKSNMVRDRLILIYCKYGHLWLLCILMAIQWQSIWPSILIRWPSDGHWIAIRWPSDGHLWQYVPFMAIYGHKWPYLQYFKISRSRTMFDLDVAPRARAQEDCRPRQLFLR